MSFPMVFYFGNVCLSHSGAIDCDKKRNIPQISSGNRISCVALESQANKRFKPKKNVCIYGPNEESHLIGNQREQNVYFMMPK